MSPQQANEFFLQVAMEIREKQKNFVNCSLPEHFQREFSSGEAPQNPYALRVQNMFMKGGVEDHFDRVLPARSWELPVERELPAKIGRCYEKLSGGFCSKVKILTAQLFVTSA